MEDDRTKHAEGIEGYCNSELIAPLQVGDLVQGKYRLIDNIGKGGMGVVFKVEEIFLQRQLALKTLVGNEFSESSIKRFQSEAKLLGRLDHPGVVKLRDFGLIDDSKPFLVMDFVHGRTLSSVLKTSGVMPLELALKMFIELCFALGYAHSKGVVHRDIKPGNIMLTTPGIDSENEHIRILDFGIAKLIHSEATVLTKTGEIFGSPLYMSPEQCSGEPIDHRSDIYSMGCVLYEALTGAPPFCGDTSLATIMMHRNTKPLSLKEASLGQEYPLEVEKLISRLLEKDPKHRYQSLLDVAKDLIDIQKRITSIDTSSSIVAAKNLHHKQNWYVVAPLLIAIVVVPLLIWGWTILSNTSESPTAAGPIALEDTSQFSTLSKNGTKKTFAFPKEFSLGTLRYQTPIGIQTMEAHNTVIVPREVGLIFAPNHQFLAHPQYFRRFRPDDLYGLDFRSTGVMDNRFSDKQPVYQLSDDELLFCDRMTELRKIQLRDNKITDKGLAHISDLPRLESLDVDRTNVTSDGIMRMKCFRNLWALKAGYIEGGGRKLVDAVSKSRKLRDLSLSNSQLTDADLKKLAKISSLEHLNLSWNPSVTDLGMSYLTELKRLRSLSILQCQITPKSLAYFRQLNLTEPPKVSLGDWPMEARNELSKMFPAKRTHEQ